jgi:CheY-like chemotaxis protein
MIASFPIGAVIVSRAGSVVFANRAFHRIAPDLIGVFASQRLTAGVEESLRSGNVVSGIPVKLGARAYQASVIPLGSSQDYPETEALVTFEDAGESPDTPAGNLSEWPALLWTVDPATRRFRWVDGGREHLLGYPREHWLNTPDFWRERIHPGDRDPAVRLYELAVSKGGEFASEFRAVTAGRSTVWCRESFLVTLDRSGNAIRIAGLTTNISGHRRAERDSLQANRVDALVGLARWLSHEFNNSLMVVTGHGEELLSRLEETDARRADVKSILAAAETMANHTGELDGFARSQASPAAALDLHPVFTAAAGRIREELGVTLELHLPPEPLAALADVTQLEAMLLSVARRLRNKSDPRMTLEAGKAPVDELSNLPRTLAPGQYVQISLRAPHASAIPASAFESLIAGPDPHGVDLARSYAIVREWGGSISVDHLDRTAEVRIVLAAAPEQPAASPAKPAAPAVTVLVIEDTPGIRSLVRKTLEKEGYEVLEAASAEEALEVARRSPSRIRLLIADLKLDGKTGRDVADALIRRNPELGVLYITACAAELDALARPTGPDAGFLQKPFTLAALRKKVREMSAAGRRPAQAAAAASA